MIGTDCPKCGRLNVLDKCVCGHELSAGLAFEALKKISDLWRELSEIKDKLNHALRVKECAVNYLKHHDENIGDDCTDIAREALRDQISEYEANYE